MARKRLRPLLPALHFPTSCSLAPPLRCGAKLPEREKPREGRRHRAWGQSAGGASTPGTQPPIFPSPNGATERARGASPDGGGHAGRLDLRFSPLPARAAGIQFFQFIKGEGRMYILNCTEEVRWLEQGGVASAAGCEQRRFGGQPGRCSGWLRHR